MNRRKLLSVDVIVKIIAVVVCVATACAMVPAAGLAFAAEASGAATQESAQNVEGTTSAAQSSMADSAAVSEAAELAEPSLYSDAEIEALDASATAATYTIEASTTGDGTVSISVLGASATSAQAGKTVTVTALPTKGNYTAQVRYALATDAQPNAQGVTSLDYQTATVAGENQYTFVMPEGNVLVMADFVSVVWDGTLDVTWYSADQTEFYLQYAAQFEGLAAIINGAFNNYPTTESLTSDGLKYQALDAEAFNQKMGVATSAAGKTTSNLYGEFQSVYTIWDSQDNYAEHAGIISTMRVVGNPAAIVLKSGEGEEDQTTTNESNLKTSDNYFFGADDFNGKTVYITDDLDFGATKTSAGLWDTSSPLFMSLGGQYAMLPGNSYSIIGSSFNGTLDGMGHSFKNVYGERYISGLNYGDSQSNGIVGRLGIHDDEAASKAALNPTVRCIVLESGLISARRSTGGIVGKIGQTTASKLKDGSAGGVVEYCINKADVRGTDKKGIGGIVGAAWNTGIIRYCANFGNISVTNAGTGFLAGGIAGSAEVQIQSCYNVGKVTAGSDSCAMAIATNNGGAQLTKCYWLEGSAAGGGYYSSGVQENANVVKFASGAAGVPKASQLGAEAWVDAASAGSNSAANAYGGVNYPVLYYQSSTYAATEYAVSVSNPAVGGTVVVSKSKGRQGDTIYMTAKPATGYTLDHYVVNGVAQADSYFTLSKATTVSAVFREVEVVKVSYDTKAADYTFTITKTGLSADGASTVTGASVNNGDAVYEGDILTIKVAVNDGAAPSTSDLEYSGTFRLKITAKDGTATTLNGGKANGVTYAVKGTEGTLTLSATLNTSTKSWESQADASWYDAAAPKSAYTLTTSAQLAGLAILVNSEGVSFKGCKITLGKNVSLEDPLKAGAARNWVPIGTASNPFKGTFDGGSRTISNLSCTGTNMTALFGAVENATIKNVTVEGTVTGSYMTAGIIAQAEGATVQNCTAKVAVTSGTPAAGVCAYASNSTFVDCVNEGTVEIPASLNSTTSAAGGIAGRASDTTFKYCTNSAAISGAVSSGGIVGEGSSGALTISGSSNTGNIAGCNRAGGLIGYSNGAVIADSCNLGGVSAGGSTYSTLIYVGGIVGFDGSLTLESVYNTGAVEILAGDATAVQACAGGLFGCASKASIDSAYNAGSVSAEKSGANKSFSCNVGTTGTSGNTLNHVYALKGAATDLLLTSTGAVAADAGSVYEIDSTDLPSLADGLSTSFTAGTAGLAGISGVAAPVLLWQMPSNRITYVLNGGQNASSNPSVQLRGTAVELAEPTRSGFTFTGWFTNAALTSKVQSLAATQATDITLYAGWTCTFNDVVAGSWYETGVNFVAARGLIGGYTNDAGPTGTYGVGDPLQRAQFATILWRYSCPDAAEAYDASSAVNTSGMADVESGTYYTQAANWAKSNGVITGFEEDGGVTTFRPYTNVTFEQMVVILARLTGSEAEIAAADTSILSRYSDGGAVSSWAQNAMAWAISKGLVEGYGGTSLAPGEDVSRERAAVLLYKAFNMGFLE